MRRPQAWRTWRALFGALAAAAGLGFAGCTSVRNDLGTSSGACYEAIPAATAAVHHHGELHGVRLVGTGALRGRAPALYRAATAAHQRNVCLVAFTGEYSSAGVTDPVGKASGDVAVVELGYPDHRVLGTLVLIRQPLPFGHSHILPF